MSVICFLFMGILSVMAKYGANGLPGSGVKDVTKWRVVIGDTDLRRKSYNSQAIKRADNAHIYNVTKLVLHSGYRPGQGWHSGNDIAIVKLERRIDPMIPARPITLPSSATDNAPGDSLCMAAGYGATGSGWDKSNGRNLYYTQVKIADNDVCYFAYNRKYPIRANNVCILGNPGNICSGDSGSGILCPRDNGRQVLEGIVSWTATGCSKVTDHPSVLTRTSQFLDWIKRNRS